MLDSQQRAREIRRRLWNSPNARPSSEVEILPTPLWDRKKEAVRAKLEAQRAKQDFKTQVNFERVLRAAKAADALLTTLTERAHAIAIARVICKEDSPNDWAAPPPRFDAIIDAVCEQFRVSKVDLLSRRRTRIVVIPRWVAMYIARHCTFCSVPEIGRLLGGKDHTTILHGVRQVTQMLADGDEQLARDIRKIKQALGLEV